MTAPRDSGVPGPGDASGADEEVARRVPFTIAGACDTHIHVFGPVDRFPFVAERGYTPPEATMTDYRKVMATLGIERVVLSQPSVHGLDNGALLSALHEGGAVTRGVVDVHDDVEDSTLQDYHDAGVRAVRTHVKPGVDLTGFKSLAGRVVELGWHVEIHANVSVTNNIDEVCADFPTRVIIEHMGHIPPEVGVANPGFQALLRMIRDGGWVMLSGPYLHSKVPPPHEDIRPFVDAILEVGSERAVWGSNWPHPHQDPVPDEWFWADAVTHWIDDEDVLHRVLVTNPADLYDFQSDAK